MILDKKLCTSCLLCGFCDTCVDREWSERWRRGSSDLSEVGFVVGHLLLDVADGADDVLTGGVMLGLKGHGTVSVS